MVRTVDYETRKKAVLSKTIKKYIKAATPVASEDIAADFDLSSATIRNIFVDLENSGYITHPYTSGGRIPTNKGYRYYVDFLILQLEVLKEEKDSISKEFEKKMSQIEDVLEKASEIISTITHYAGITSFLKGQDKVFYRGLSLILDQPEFQNLARTRIILKMIEDKPRLLNLINRDFADKVKVYIGQELECPEMDNCSLVVSNYRIKNRPMGKLAVLGPTRMEYDHIIPTLEYISDVLTEGLDRV